MVLKILLSYWVRFEPCLSIPCTATPAAGLVCQLLSSWEDKDMPLFSSFKFEGKREEMGKIWRYSNEIVRAMRADVCQDRDHFLIKRPFCAGV